MPYVDVYKGQRETGKMLKCVSTVDGVEHDLGDYPETVDEYDTVWQTPLCVEHVPVGSVVLYGERNNGELLPYTVTGHVQNGIRSYVVTTDGECQIWKDGRKASFNIVHIKGFISRGTGGIRWNDDKGHSTSEYLKKLRDDDVVKSLKRPHLYAGINKNALIHSLLETHPAFATYRNRDQPLAHAIDILPVIQQYFVDHRPDNYFGYTYYTANKKKLIKAMLRVLPRMRLNVAVLKKQEEDLFDGYDFEDETF